MRTVGQHDVERFRQAIARRLGLQIEDARQGLLGDVLQCRLARTGLSAEAYLRELEAGAAPAEPAALARQLTVGETYFFRNIEQFRALRQIALPQRMQANASLKTLRILSAGCASGEEPYSIAIAVRESIPDPTWDIEIRAVDLNAAALKKAARGRYSPWALRETPSEVMGQWFRTEHRELVLDETVRAAVRFQEANLATDDTRLWRPGSLDIVFCRNVIMYFAPEQAQALLARIARALRPGGYLFLGHAETLRGISDEFHLRHTHGTFYYQRKEAHEVSPSPSLPEPLKLLPAGSDTPGVGDAWVDVIRTASERVTALAAAAKPAPQPTAGMPSRWDLAAVLELLRKEQFVEALAALRGLPAAAARDPDVLLVTATLLVHSGQPGMAEETCRQILALDELNAGAHYLYALCREARGDRAGAVEHDRVAIYLDPGFAMPRLHLGLLARRAGDRDAARRELFQALVLLRREDASRLLLFGGGFGRDALLALCGSALRECGGAS